jgi:hypothetical protein
MGSWLLLQSAQTPSSLLRLHNWTHFSHDAVLLSTEFWLILAQCIHHFEAPERGFVWPTFGGLGVADRWKIQFYGAGAVTGGSIWINPLAFDLYAPQNHLVLKMAPLEITHQKSRRRITAAKFIKPKKMIKRL